MLILNLEENLEHRNMICFIEMLILTLLMEIEDSGPNQVIWQGGGGDISILDIYSVSKMTFDIVSQSL